MENYYEHFVNKGNHPDKALILKQEDDYSFDNFNRDQALKLVNNIVAIAKKLIKKQESKLLSMMNQLFNIIWMVQNIREPKAGQIVRKKW